MEGFPLLPGYTFSDDLTRTDFRVRHNFEYINGYRIPLLSDTGKAKGSLAADSLRFKEALQPVRYDPSLTYGRTQTYPYSQFVPMFALYRGKCLCFKAFFKQSVFESRDETYRVRKINIIYFLEDDTICVQEPAVKNAGYLQGQLVRRAKIPKDTIGNCYHWKDLNIGIDVAINCIVCHIVDADTFTKEFLESQGVEVNPEEEMPTDPYTEKRRYRNPAATRRTEVPDDKLRRLLEYDKKVLRFFAVMDEEGAGREKRNFAIHYYLQDDTIEVFEKTRMNDGRDPFPCLLRRIKCPKNWKDIPESHIPIYRELLDQDVEEYYSPKDFKIGETVFLYARRFLIYDCDQFTRNFYQNCLNTDVGEPLNMFRRGNVKEPQEPVPRYTGFGGIEDSLQSHYRVQPRPAKKNVARMFINEGKKLTYEVVLDELPEEGKSQRKFVLSYHLANGEIELTELLTSDTDQKGSRRFLRPTLIPKPDQDPFAEDPELYTPADFFIGAKLIIFSRRFFVTGAGLQVYRYMQANPNKFSSSVVDSVRNYCVANGYLREEIADETKAIVKEQTQQCLDIEECCKDVEPTSSATPLCVMPP